MSRMRAVAALAAISMLSNYPQFSNITEADALRIRSRVERARAARGPDGMSMGALQDWARRRRRARQTHPGKRRGN